MLLVQPRSWPRTQPRHRWHRPSRRSRPAIPSWIRRCRTPTAHAVGNGKKVDVQAQWIGGEGANFACHRRRLPKATGINGPGRQHRLEPRDRAEDAHRGRRAARPGACSPSRRRSLAYAAAGKIIDVASFMDAKKLSDRASATIGLVTQDGKIWGMPYKADVKSTIWYPIKAFAAKGYTGPDDVGRADRPIRSRSSPTAATRGASAPEAPARRRAGSSPTGSRKSSSRPRASQYYNDWISHKVTFDDPGIKAAFDKVAKIFFTPNYVLRRQHRHREHRPEAAMDPMFNEDAAAPEVLDAEDPDLVRPGLLPGSACQRAARPSTSSGE